MAQIETVELDSHNFPAPRGDFLGPWVSWDNNNDQHEVWTYQEGTNQDDSTTLNYRRTNSQGVVTATANNRLRNDAANRPMKYVQFGAPFVIIPPGQSVGTIVVPYTGHGAGPNSGRLAVRGYHKIAGVYAPHTRGTNENELWDVVIPDIAPPPPDPNPDPGPGGGVDEATVRKVLGIGQNPTDPPFTQVFGGHRSFRTGVMEKTTDGLLWLLDPQNNDPKATAFRYLLHYRQIGDGAYEACMNAIRDSGLGADKAVADVVADKVEIMPDDVRTALEEMRARLASED